MNGNKTGFIQTVGFGCRCGLNDYFSLLKIHLCLYIGLSAMFGHVTAKGLISPEAFYCGVFVLILACGSAVLNNIQDRAYDRFFPRTQNRSLPQKKVPVPHAKILAVLLIFLGLSGILYGYGAISFFWGVMAVLCYNGLYTPLKKRSLLAIVPGSLCGMLPVLMGWTGAGNSILDPFILITMSIFAVWQIPHFFIVLLKTRPLLSCPADSDRFPSFTTFFSLYEIKLQVLIWTSLYSLGILLFLVTGSIQNPSLLAILWMNAFGIILVMCTMVLTPGRQTASFAFWAINLSMFFFLGAGICDNWSLFSIWVNLNVNVMICH